MRGCMRFSIIRVRHVNSTRIIRCITTYGGVVPKGSSSSACILRAYHDAIYRSWSYPHYSIATVSTPICRPGWATTLRVERRRAGPRVGPRCSSIPRGSRARTVQFQGTMACKRNVPRQHTTHDSALYTATQARSSHKPPPAKGAHTCICIVFDISPTRRIAIISTMSVRAGRTCIDTIYGAGWEFPRRVSFIVRLRYGGRTYGRASYGRRRPNYRLV